MNNNGDNIVETIRALTPIVLAFSGVAVCAIALLAPGISDAVRSTSGYTGAGGVAFGGAAGVSQSSKPRSSPTMSSANVDTVNIEQNPPIK